MEIRLIYTLINIIAITQSLQIDPCGEQKTCHGCIQTPSCAWCHDSFPGRCFQPSIGPGTCDESFIVNPDNSFMFEQNDSLTEVRSIDHRDSWSSTTDDSQFVGSIESQERIIHIAPQKLSLKLRTRNPYSIDVSYKRAYSLPQLDLYYLVDHSIFMENETYTLYSLGEQLVDTLKNLTSDFRIGFGSFAKKNSCAEALSLSCTDFRRFRQHMALGNDTEKFLHLVNETGVSDELNTESSVFGALKQAVFCRDLIGWRKNAVKLLVLATSSGSQTGIVEQSDGTYEPNDELCNITIKIGQMGSSENINVIFAVTQNVAKTYEQLTSYIDGALVGKIGENILELVKIQYEKVLNTIEMTHNATDYVSLRFYSNCNNSTSSLRNTNTCQNIKAGDVVHFRIEIEVLQCPKYQTDHSQIVHIHPVGMAEGLIISLEMLCECYCEKPGSQFYEEFSPKCSRIGTYKCGVCDCGRGASGPVCQCYLDYFNATYFCINPVIPSLECSGRGSCVCGRCYCNVPQNYEESIYGRFCECDNFSCDRHEGKQCSGHGTCECGICRCEEGWSGSACSCTTSLASCYAPSGHEICSGRGACVCGTCVCDYSEDGRYSGRYCERCPTCPDRCSELKNCVQCQQYKTGPYNDSISCANNCLDFTSISVQTVKAEDDDTVLCTYYDEDDCRFSFVYHYDEDNKLLVRAEAQRNCPNPLFIVDKKSER